MISNSYRRVCECFNQVAIKAIGLEKNEKPAMKVDRFIHLAERNILPQPTWVSLIRTRSKKLGAVSATLNNKEYHFLRGFGGFLICHAVMLAIRIVTILSLRLSATDWSIAGYPWASCL